MSNNLNTIHKQTKKSFKIGRYTISFIYKCKIKDWNTMDAYRGWTIQIKDRIDQKYKQKTYDNADDAEKKFKQIYIDNNVNWKSILNKMGDSNE